MDEAQFLIDTFRQIETAAIANTGHYARHFGSPVDFATGELWIASNAWQHIAGLGEGQPEPYGFETQRLSGLHLALRLIEEGRQFQPWTIECHMVQRSMLWFRSEDDALLARLMVNG